MNNLFTSTSFNSKPHLHILKTLIITANILVLFLFVFLHIVFYDMPFELQEELPAVAAMAGIASLAAVAVSFVLFSMDGIHHLIHVRKTFKLPNLFPISEG